MSTPRHAKANVILSGCTFDGVPTAPAVYAALPATSSAAGRAVILTPGRVNRVTVYLVGTDAADENFIYAMSGYLPIRTDSGNGYIQQSIAAGLATLGAKTLGTSAAFIDASTSLFADTLTDTLSSPRAVVFSPTSDLVAWIAVDCTEYDAIIVWVTNAGSTAASMTVLAQRSVAKYGLAEEP